MKNRGEKSNGNTVYGPAILEEEVEKAINS